jgi:hypothetical protein
VSYNHQGATFKASLRAKDQLLGKVAARLGMTIRGDGRYTPAERIRVLTVR